MCRFLANCAYLADCGRAILTSSKAALLLIARASGLATKKDVACVHAQCFIKITQGKLPTSVVE